MLDTIDLFPPDLIASLQTHAAEADDSVAVARACRTSARISARRAKAEAHLAEIIPALVDEGDSWHVISHGDIDSLSYLAHALDGVPHFDHVVVSTWCMARADLDRLADWLDSGRIDQLDFYVGEIFPNQYGDEYARLLEMADVYGCRVVVARNHSKIMLMQWSGGGVSPGVGEQRQHQHQPANRANHAHSITGFIRVLPGVFFRPENDCQKGAA